MVFTGPSGLLGSQEGPKRDHTRRKPSLIIKPIMKSSLFIWLEDFPQKTPFRRLILRTPSRGLSKEDFPRGLPTDDSPRRLLRRTPPEASLQRTPPRGLPKPYFDTVHNSEDSPRGIPLEDSTQRTPPEDSPQGILLGGLWGIQAPELSPNPFFEIGHSFPLVISIQYLILRTPLEDSPQGLPQRTLPRGSSGGSSGESRPQNCPHFENWR